MRLRPPNGSAAPEATAALTAPAVPVAPQEPAAPAQEGTPGPPGHAAGGKWRARRARWTATARQAAPRSTAAAAFGLMMAAAFPPYGVWPLSAVAVAGLALVLEGRTVRQGAWLGFAFAFPFFVWLLVWLRSVIWLAVVGLSAIEALYVVVMAALMVVARRLPWWPLWAACLWVTQELVRDRLPFGGFPWGRLAFANTGSPFTPLAALGGAPLVSFAVALSGTLLAAAVLAAVRTRADAPPTLPRPLGRLRAALSAGGRPGGRTATAGAPYGLLTALGALALSAAVLLSGLLVPIHTNAVGHLKVAIVQGNVQQPGLHFLGRPMKILDNHVQATLKLAAEIDAGKVPRPDIVLWPENSSDLDPFSYPQAYAKITEAVQAVGVPVLVGALVDGPDKAHVQNEGILWDPVTGPGAHYTKQHPVPFGEYVPFRRELTKVIPMLKEIPKDFYPGKATGVLKVGPGKATNLGDVICFEVAYDGIVRDTVNAGAQAIVVQTNNATYGRTGQPEQQLAMSRLRAVEHGRAVVTAATSGISAVVGPDGRIEQRSKEFTQALISADIPLRDEKTVADRVGAAPEWALAMVGLLSCAVATAIGRLERTRMAKGQSQQ